MWEGKGRTQYCRRKSREGGEKKGLGEGSQDYSIRSRRRGIGRGDVGGFHARKGK